MSDSIVIILEQLYNNDLSFDSACDKLSNLLLKETNEKTYKEFINIVSNGKVNGSFKN